MREGIPPTAAIMTLAAISTSSRTTPGGIPMASRAISASSKGVAVAASMPRTRSTVVIARRRKGIFTDRWVIVANQQRHARRVGSPGAARVPRDFSRAGAPDAVEDPSPLSHQKTLPPSSCTTSTAVADMRCHR
jgi:hypothetical protein